MATYRSTLPEVYEARLAELFYKNLDEEPTTYTQVARIEPSTKAYEDWFEVSGLGSFRLKPEGTPISYDDPIQGTRRRVVHATFALGSRISFEAVKDAQYSVIDEIPKDLAASGREHQEILFWGLLNNGFTTTPYVTIDGLALFSASHVILKPKDPASNTISNIASPGVALSVTGIEDALTAMRTTKSREDRYTPVRPTKLIVHPSKAHLAYQLLDTQAEPFTNENQSNTIRTSRTGITPMDVPWLTAANTWFLLADKSVHKLTYHNRMDLTFDTGVDMQTKDNLADAMYRASVAPKEWRGTYGSAP